MKKMPYGVGALEMEYTITQFFHWCFSTTLRIKCISVIENLSKAKTFRNNDFTHTFKMIRHAPNTQIPKMKYKLRNS